MSATVSRRTFVAGAGAGTLAVAFGLGGRAAWAAPPAGLLRIDPTAATALATEHWLVVTPDAITVYAGKVELGTGVRTALAQVVAEELRLGVTDLRWVQGDTRLSPSQGTTAGSKTLQNGGPELRAAAATAFAELRRLAAAHLAVPDKKLHARDGAFHANGRSVAYGELLRGKEIALDSSTAAPLVAPKDFRVVGREQARLDLPDKLTARFPYVHDIRLPGMLHGRVVRPAGRNQHSAVVGNLARAQAIPGFRRVVQDGDFIGVVADTEWAAARAANPQFGITVVWQNGPAFMAEADLPALLRDPANTYRSQVEPETTRGDVDAVFAAPGAKVLQARYDTPFQMHAAMGASCAVADVRTTPDPDTGVVATVWSGTQGVTALRGALRRLLALSSDAQVRVLYEEASGCYGHNGADDVAADAALLSKAAGAPVRVQWTRQDEHKWEPYGGAQAHDMRGAVDASGITGWEHTVYALTTGSRPAATNPGTLLAGALTRRSLPGNLPTSAGNGSGRNCPVTYAFADHRVNARLVRSFRTTGAQDNAPATPLTYLAPRTSALRSLGGFSNSFANEAFFDELAHAGGHDPLELRIASMEDPRAIAVLERLRPAWAARRRLRDGQGAGVAFQQYEIENAYCATLCEVDVDRATGVVRVTRVVVAHDCGLIVNPDGLVHQVEGNVVQGVSRTLKEEVHYTGDRITSTVWESNAFNPTPQYEVLRFDEVPEIEVLLIDRPTEPPWGAGEPAIGTLGGAIANAVFAAVGVRFRRLPLTPARVKAALA